MGRALRSVWALSPESGGETGALRSRWKVSYSRKAGTRRARPLEGRGGGEGGKARSRDMMCRARAGMGVTVTIGDVHNFWGLGHRGEYPQGVRKVTSECRRRADCLVPRE